MEKKERAGARERATVGDGSGIGGQPQVAAEASVPER
jgi:hypothetical protein